MTRYLQRTTEGGVAVLTLARPPVNALNFDVYGELLASVSDLAADRSVRVMVLRTEQGARAFSAGADIKEFERLFDPVQAQAFFTLAHEVTNAIEGLDIITVVAIDGPALGGGAELALSFDLRVAGE